MIAVPQCCIIDKTSACSLVQGVLEGYNGTVFAYGQTGCGKSFTMQGIPNPPTQRGIIPRSFEHIFEAIDSCENMKYLVHASYLEIYNEDIRDLLGKDVTKKLTLKEHPDRGVYVAGELHREINLLYNFSFLKEAIHAGSTTCSWLIVHLNTNVKSVTFIHVGPGINCHFRYFMFL